MNVQDQLKTRKNYFRYLKLMSPLIAAICTTISYTLELFDLEIKAQGPLISCIA